MHGQTKVRAVSNTDTDALSSLFFNGIVEHNLGKTVLVCSTDGFVHFKTKLLLEAQ